MMKIRNISCIIILIMAFVLTGCNDQSASFEAARKSNNMSEVTEEMAQEVIIKSYVTQDNEPTDYERVMDYSVEPAKEPSIEVDPDVQPSAVEMVDLVETEVGDLDEVVVEEEVANGDVSVQIIGPLETLMSTSVLLEPDDSVFDVLVRASEEMGIRIDYTGKGQLAYLQGIENIYEFDYGANSGWLYAVNGLFPSKGMGNYFPEEGDEILIQYTLDGGYDIGSR